MNEQRIPDRPECFLCATPVEEIEGGLRLDLCKCCGISRGALCAQCYSMVERIDIVGVENVLSYLGATIVPGPDLE